MYHRILLAYDGSEEGRAVLSQGADLARVCGARVLLLAVQTVPAGVAIGEAIIPAEMADEVVNETRQSLEAGERRLKQQGLEVESRLTRGEPVEQIAAAASQWRADLIVVGHRHQGPLARWWGGSVGRSLLSQAPCSLLIAIEPS